MATIQKRVLKDGTIRYRAIVRIRGTSRQEMTFDRKTDAKNWANKIETEIRDGKVILTSQASRHTFGELIDRYTESILPRKKSSKDQKRHLDWWKTELGDRFLCNITPSLLAEYRDSLLKGGRSKSTANRYLASLGHPFTIAIREWGWVSDHPVHKISKLPEPRGRIRFLSKEELKKLVEACKNQKNPDLLHSVVLSLATGARQAEIFGLEWERVDLEKGRLTFTETKNKEIRTVPIRGYALELIRERGRVQRLDTDLVFPGRKLPTKPVSVRGAFENALEEAGIEDFRWHDLRHTAASYLAMDGANASTIAAVLGHKTLAMVKRYAHLSEDSLGLQIESMNKSLFGG
ncbi:site-specific integrase [bacterium]|nr:site-specific integrase [bacterium]